ncbi:MAG TPA: tripartite tricarboxylate transporter substrate binding protein [Burkholderiales bacterium]|nr:tripartite tricarboxylate transporter substrate binding protein [Burkholderiales bacterium]
MTRGLLVVLALGCVPALAQPWPAKPVTLVAPSTPGSAPDVLARVMAQKLSENLGQPMVVVNRPGAGTNIGTVSVAQAAPDGYTVLLGSIANTLNPHIMAKVGYRILEDFAPASSVAAAPDVLVVHPSFAPKTVGELIAALKAKPGTPAGHAGIGTTPHLSLETFRRAAGVDVTLVPFKGGGEAQQGILGGQVPFMFSTTIGILPRVKSGQVRALAVSSGKRIAAAPELPTVAETLPGFDVVAWFGFFLPAATPKAVVERLSSETRAALSSPEVAKRLIDLGAEPLGSTPQEFAAYVQSEYQRWGKLAREAGMKIQ